MLPMVPKSAVPAGYGSREISVMEEHTCRLTFWRVGVYTRGKGGENEGAG